MKKTIDLNQSNRMAKGTTLTGLLMRRFSEVIAFGLLICSTAQVHAQDKMALDWANRIAGATYDEANRVVTDKQGNVYVAGGFTGKVDFNPATGVGDTAYLTATTGITFPNSEADVFVAKYDPAGNYLWAKRLGGNKDDRCWGIAVDSAGDVYATGYCKDWVTISDTNLTLYTGATHTDMFLIKWNANGDFQWVKQMGSALGIEQGSGLAIDAAGNVLVTGYFSLASDFDLRDAPNTNVLLAAGGQDVFIAKYSPSGNCLWAKGMGGNLEDRAHSIDLDASGNIYITGHFNGTADFNPGAARDTLVSAGGVDIFVAKYDPNGNYLWANAINGAGTIDISYSIAATDSGDVYVTGSFNSPSINFNTSQNDTLARISQLAYGVLGGDMFLAKYNTHGVYQWAGNVGTVESGMATAISGVIGQDVSVDRVGNIYVTGRTQRDADFNFSPALSDTAWLRSIGDNNMFVAKYSPNGHYIWGYNVGVPGAPLGQGIFGSGIHIGPSGHAYICGVFGQGLKAFDIDPSPEPADTLSLIPVAGTDAFVVKWLCNDTSSAYLTVEACQFSYTLNGETYTSNGIYTQVMPNIYGCDSTITLDLTFNLIKPVITPNGVILGTTLTYTSYQWIKNGVDIPGATNATYVADENTDYQVRVVDADGCEGISDVYTVNNISVKYFTSHNSVYIYPNPAQNRVHITSATPVSVVVSSMEGRVILHQKDTREIDIAGIADGAYLLQVTDANGMLLKTEKLVKQSR